jgi:hypothetical protein
MKESTFDVVVFLVGVGLTSYGAYSLNPAYGWIVFGGLLIGAVMVSRGSK